MIRSLATRDATATPKPTAFPERTTVPPDASSILGGAATVARMSFRLVQRHHVKRWADQKNARYGLAELVERLIVETTGGSAVAEFAVDEGVDLGGFDGRVRADTESGRVPAGSSVWELSVERSVGTKADEDYDGRVSAPPGWSTPETVYVAVSLRPWLARADWAHRRTGEGRWRKVRTLGLDDIMSWLLVAPGTELWLAELLGLHPFGLESGRSWWKCRLQSTGDLFDQRVALAGRSDAAEGFRRRLAEGTGMVIVEAAAIGEALEFVAAAAEIDHGSGGGDSLLDRMVFVSGSDAWRRLLAEQGPPMVLVAGDPELSERSLSSKHTVVVPVLAQGGSVVARPGTDGSRDRVVVPRLDARSVAEALNSPEARRRGIDFHRAQELGTLGHRSASALRRQLSVNPTLLSPSWARSDAVATLSTRRAKTAALLAGEWDAGSSAYGAAAADRLVLTVLAGGRLEYETIEIELHAVATGADPMLTTSGSSWRLVAPREAWLLASEPLLNADAIDRFLRVAAEVLGEEDPVAGFSRDEHVAAQLRGARYAFSLRLRRGIARTLALLSAHGLGRLRQVGNSTAARARQCVERLLSPAQGDSASNAARVSRLVGLGDVLPLLAEAAPSEFVSAVDRTLRSPSEIARLWFTDSRADSSVWGASSPHTPLLFAVETLAWLPDHLPDVADILVHLECGDPGGRLANRPAETFASVFSAWAPQTGTDHQQRLDVLRGLRDRLVDSSTDGHQLRALVRLLARLVPRSGSSVVSTSRPEVRDYELPPEPVDREAEDGYVEQVVELLLSLVEHRIRERGDVAGMLDMLDASGGALAATSLPAAARRRLWTLFEEAVPMFEPEELTTVGHRLTNLTRVHREYPNAAWALPADETDRLARLAEQIATSQTIPDSPVEAHLWLFEEFFPLLGPEPSQSDDVEAYEQMLRERRANAVGEVIRAAGLNGLYQLAAHIDAHPGAATLWSIGAALEQTEPDLHADVVPTSPSIDIEARMLAALDLPADDMATRLDAGREARIASGYFAARFRRMRLAAGDGWAWLAELLHRPGVNAFQQARLIELTRDHPRAWQEAEALGGAPLTEYWKLMNWGRLGIDFGHLEDVARGLLSVDRSADAVKFLALHNRSIAFGPDCPVELAVDALEALNVSTATQPAETIGHRSAVKLLDSLADYCPLTADNLNEPLLQRLTRLEIAYVKVRRPRESAPFIHHRMALDPSTFVEQVCIAHHPDDEHTQDLDPDAHMSPEERAWQAERRDTGWRILAGWQHPPGVDSTGVVDYEQLSTWIDQAQQLLDIKDRRGAGDCRIGRVLSAAPPEPDDGVAPPIAIRRLVEARQTPQFEEGLVRGLQHGPTGTGGGWVTELIARSQQGSEQALCNAARIASRWPRTARLLGRVADAHEEHARAWQQRD